MQFLNFKRQISCSPYVAEKSSMKLITFLQHSQNQQDSLCEDRGEAHLCPAPLQLCSNVEDHRTFISNTLCHCHGEECQHKKTANYSNKCLLGPSIWSIQRFPHWGVTKILVLVTAEPPKASEHLNSDTKNSKYRILQMRKLHRRLNFIMQPFPTKSRNKRSKTMRVRWELDLQNQRQDCQTQERLEY